jgi:hypothetical protein
MSFNTWHVADAGVCIDSSATVGSAHCVDGLVHHAVVVVVWFIV